MTHHPVVTGILLGIAVGLAIVCSIGVLVMRDAYQRIHFSFPVVTICIFLIAVAVFVEERDSQARIKIVMIFALMMTTNSILSHATARAIRIRSLGRWEPAAEEGIPVRRGKGVAGEQPWAGDEE
jgi:multisubunit Na+/H+ antiporter MnhG subunit